jgi:hypothetical protein
MRKFKLMHFDKNEITNVFKSLSIFLINNRGN